jgi:hypothetical protein
MKPLYIKKNGQVEKVTGAFAMPASYPAERVAYDNTNSGLSADDAQGAIDEIVEEVNDKVDKETGKGLSTNDFTNEDKALIGQTLGNNTVLTTDKTPFLTRQTLNPTGFSGYVREKLIGASYAWNQILPNGNFADTSIWNSSKATMSILSNIATLVPNGQSASNIEIYEKPAEKSTKIVGHKYLISLEIKPSQAVNVNLAGFTGGQVRIITSATASSWTKGQSIVTCTTDAIADFYIYSTTESFSTSDSVQVKNIQIIDLTLAFGSTIADYLYGLSNNGGITKLRDMGCPIDKYTAYGNYLVSSKTSGKKIVGKNKCGGFVAQTGTATTISKNGDVYTITGTSGGAFVNWKCKANVRYVFSYTLTSGTIINVRLYDDLSASNYIAQIASGVSFVPPQDCYVRIWIDGTIVLTNVQLEEGSTASTYEKYTETTYSLGNDELRGKFDLVNGEIVASGDVKESNGKIDRTWKMPFSLGSLSWTKSSSSNQFYANMPSNVSTGNNIVCVCSKYGWAKYISGWTDLTDKEYGVRGGTIRIFDNSYTDATTFANSLTDVYCTCILATSTTEQSTPFADPMSLVGATTEEYIDTRDIPCPVGAERQYMGQSEDVVEIPSSPLSDGKRVLISEVSGGKNQVYWDVPTLYYKEYTVQGDGTKTYGDLLAELKPYYEALSEDEKTYSKVMMRATSSGNECLTFVGNYWYSRMGVNASGLWLDQIDFQYNKYFKQVGGGSIIDYTNTNAGYDVFALRVLTYTRAES